MYAISVVVPVFNEEKFIEAFYHSLLNQKNLDFEQVEILFIDGNSEDQTLQKIHRIYQGNKQITIRIFHNEKRQISAALNIGLKESVGKYIVRLDVHSTIPSDYISLIYRELTEHDFEYCNFGGRTDAKGYDNTSKVIAKALSTKWVIGGAQFRYARKKMEVDSIFPGAWLKQDLVTVGGWDEGWLVNEDAELNHRLRTVTNKKIILDPNIVINYFPRNTLRKLGKQYFSYGYWRTKTAKKHEDSVRFSHLLPLFALFSLLFSIGLSFISLELYCYFLFASGMLYLFYLIGISIKIFEKEEVLLGMAVIPVIQSTWILGAFKGYFVFGFPAKGYVRLLRKFMVSKWKTKMRGVVH